MSRRDLITVPWRINRIRLLGVLEVYVIDDSYSLPPPGSVLDAAGRGGCGCACSHGGTCVGCGHGGCPERRLDLATVRGFGDMARAAFIVLVMSAGRGRSEKELDRAMNPPARGDWVKKDAIHSHISAIRRAGLKVKYESQQYRAVDMGPEQVDVLAFRRLRERVRDLEALRVDTGTCKAIEGLCREAFGLWAGDPAAAHPYVHDRHIFADDWRYYTALKGAYARALLTAANADRATLEQAGEVIEELRQLGFDAAQLADLDSLLHRHHSRRYSAATNSVQVVQHSSTDQLGWLSQYHDYLLSQVESIDLRPFGSELLSASSVETIYTPLYVKPRSSEQPVPSDQPEASRPMLDKVVEVTPGLLVVGESGSGKSTFLRHLCLRHLQREEGKVPLLLELVELSEVAERELDGRGRLASGAITRTFISHLAAEGIVAKVEDVDLLSSTGQAMWLLDGLNEIFVPELRSAVTNAISDYVRRWRNSRFVITTTEGALAAHGAPLGLTRVDIDDLRPQEVETFLAAFAADFYPRLSGDERVEKWEPLATKVLSSPDLRELARTPLQLTAIAVVYFTEGWLPESRADLLQAAVSWSIRKRTPVLRSFVRRGRDLQLLFEALILLAKSC